METEQESRNRTKGLSGEAVIPPGTVGLPLGQGLPVGEGFRVGAQTREVIKMWMVAGQRPRC